MTTIPKRDARPVVQDTTMPLDAPLAKDTLAVLVHDAATHLKSKNFAELEATLAQAAELAPDDHRVLHFQGLCAFEQHDAVTAFGFLRRALALRPKDPALQHNMAAILISLGKFENAEKLLLAAVHHKPDYAEAYHTLAQIRKFKADDPLISTMEKGLQEPGLSAQEISFYAFALAKACDDAALYDQGWKALARGNAAISKEFDTAREDKAVAALLRVATRERLHDLSQHGHPSRAPIYVVSLPRSGTTLLESVITEHPQIHAAGELTALGGIGRMLAKNLNVSESLLGFADVLENLPPEHAYSAGMGYLNAGRDTSKEWFDHFVNKLPDNTFNLGLAAALTPGARVIHIMRHPLDVMLSLYFQRFRSVNYSFNPQDILHHWRNYQRVMAHWRETLPLELIELRYENLVQDVAFAQDLIWGRIGVSRKIEHVPLAPKAGQQRTASRFQVRQPVYQSSNGKFRRYETHMGEFIDGLGGMEGVEAEVAAQEARCVLRAAVTNGE